MTPLRESEQFAARLRALKERAGVSFETLARQSGISRSSLHRYCAGSKLPADYGTAHAIAKACGASNEEFRELHRLWALADAGVSAGSAGSPGGGERADGAGESDGAAREAGGADSVRETGTDAPTGGAGMPPPGVAGAGGAGGFPWRRLLGSRIALTVAAVAVVVVVAGVVALLLADDGSSHRVTGKGLASTVSVHVYNAEIGCRNRDDHLPACSIGLARDPRRKYNADNVVAHRVWHNDVLVADCVLFEGTRVADEAGVATTRWLRVRLNDVPGGHAWLPAVRTRDSIALPTCPE